MNDWLKGQADYLTSILSVLQKEEEEKGKNSHWPLGTSSTEKKLRPRALDCWKTGSEESIVWRPLPHHHHNQEKNSLWRKFNLASWQEEQQQQQRRTMTEVWSMVETAVQFSSVQFSPSLRAGNYHTRMASHVCTTPTTTSVAKVIIPCDSRLIWLTVLCRLRMKKRTGANNWFVNCTEGTARLHQRQRRRRRRGPSLLTVRQINFLFRRRPSPLQENWAANLLVFPLWNSSSSSSHHHLSNFSITIWSSGKARGLLACSQTKAQAIVSTTTTTVAHSSN